MNFIKKRLFLIISIVVVLAGGFLFYLGWGLKSKNVEGFSKVKSQYEKVNSLSRQVVHKNVLDAYQENSEFAQADAEKVIELTKQTTSRDLIHGKVFPEPLEAQSREIYYREFATKYCEQINALIASLNAGDCPLAAEESALIEEYQRISGNTNNVAVGGAGGRGGRGGRGGGAGLNNNFATGSAEDKLVGDLRASRAKEITTYMNTDSLVLFDYWNGEPDYNNKEEMAKASWFSQIALWIQEDIIQSIGQINKAQTVYENPLKRLIEMTFCGESLRVTEKAVANIRKVGAGTTGAVVREENESQNIMPTYVSGGAGAAAPSPGGRMAPGGGRSSGSGTMVTSHTSHTSNELIDVVQFRLGVVLNTNHINEFVNVLQSVKYSDNNPEKNVRNQITVLDLRVEPIVLSEEKAGGYYYGTGSMALVYITCEYVFFKDGYDQYKPELIKQMMGEAASANAAAAGGQAASPFGGPPGRPGPPGRGAAPAPAPARGGRGR